MSPTEMYRACVASGTRLGRPTTEATQLPILLVLDNFSPLFFSTSVDYIHSSALCNGFLHGLGLAYVPPMHIS
jgi:hypothetical protein